MSDYETPPRPVVPRTRATIWWVLGAAAVIGAAALLWHGEHRSAPAERNTVEMSRSPL